MEPCSFAAFSAAARAVAAEARRRGLVVPGFRSPPRVAHAVRTLRRRADGGSVVAVRVRGRPVDVVVADLVEGVLRANGLSGPKADECRASLLDAAIRHHEVPSYPNWQRTGA